MNRKRALAIIFGIVFIDLVGFGIVIPILPLYASHFGASPLVVGLLLASYSLMQALCAPMLGRLSDRVGRRPVLLLSLMGSTAGFVLMGLADQLWLLFVARIVDGVTGGNIAAAQAYIADVTAPEDRAKGMGLIGAAFGLGFIFGPAIGGLMSQISMAAPFLTAAALAALNAVAVYFWLPESLPAEQRGLATHRESGWAALFQASHDRSLGRVMVLYFSTTTAFSMLTATYPIFAARRFGLGAAEIGYVFAFQGVLAALLQGFGLGPLVRRFGEASLILAGGLLMVASLGTLPVSPGFGVLIAATALVAAGHGLLAATLNGLASKAAPAAWQGRTLGLMQSSASVARIVGPVLGGWLLQRDVAGLPAMFGRSPYWTAAAIMAMAAVYAAGLKSATAVAASG